MTTELISVLPELGDLGDYPGLAALFLSMPIGFTSFPLESWVALATCSSAVSSPGNRLTDPPAGTRRHGEPESSWFFRPTSSRPCPAELGELGNLRALLLDRRKPVDVTYSSGLGGMASLELLDLSSNALTVLPPGVGRAWQPQATGARREPVDRHSRRDWVGRSPRKRLHTLRQRAAVHSPDLERSPLEEESAIGRAVESGCPQETGDSWSTSCERIWDVTGTGRPNAPPADRRPCRPGDSGSLVERAERAAPRRTMLEFTGLTSLGLADNAGLAGALPLNLTALEHLEDLHTVGTELCAPADPSFIDWLDGVTRQRVALCRGSRQSGCLPHAGRPVPRVSGAAGRGQAGVAAGVRDVGAGNRRRAASRPRHLLPATGR